MARLPLDPSRDHEQDARADSRPPDAVIRSLRRRNLHRGAKFDYEEITLPGSEITRQVVRHPGSVVILPILERAAGPDGAGAEGDEIVLIRNLRWSVGAYLFELPAGTRTPGEPPEQCAARELEEETGFSAATLTPLFRFYTGPGMTDELMHGFVATGLRRVGQRLEVDEMMTVHPTPIARVLEMIQSGEIMDSKSIATVLRWWVWRKSESGSCGGT